MKDDKELIEYVRQKIHSIDSDCAYIPTLSVKEIIQLVREHDRERLLDATVSCFNEHDWDVPIDEEDIFEVIDEVMKCHELLHTHTRWIKHSCQDG